MIVFLVNCRFERCIIFLLLLFDVDVNLLMWRRLKNVIEKVDLNNKCLYLDFVIVGKICNILSKS